MSAASTAAVQPPARAARGAAAGADARSVVLAGLLHATLFTIPLTKLFISAGGKLELGYALAGVYVALFVALRVAARDFAIARPAAVLLGLFVATMAANGAAFAGLDTSLQRTQFLKGYGFALLHGAFMVCAAAHMARAGRPLLHRALRWFLGGFLLSGAWALLQLVALSGAGIDVDKKFIEPLPGLAHQGLAVQMFGGGLLRATGMTLDTNHMAVMLGVPLAIVLTWGKGWTRIILTTGVLLALLLSLSRSGGLAAIGVVLWIAWHRRARALRPAVVMPIAALLVAVAIAVQVLVVTSPDLAHKLLFARLDPSNTGAQAHFDLYGTVPGLLARAPLFGIGLNNFALHFVDTSGRPDFGPHSAYIKLVVETGLAGVALFVLQIGTVLGWLRALAGDVDARLALGIGAAIIGTLAGNLFYLTTHFMYDEALYAFAAALVATYSRTDPA